MKQRLLGSLLAATLSVASLAQSSSQSGTISPYSQFGLGVLSDQSQAVGRGMGGTGIGLRGGTLVNTLNPASYAAVDSQSMVFDAGLSAQLTNFKEGGTRVNARSANFDYAVALFRVKKHLGVSVGVLPFSDIGYSYSTSSYLNNTIGSITETYMGSGGMHQAFIGAGWNLVKPLSIGFNLAYLWGDYDRGVTTTANSSVNSLSKTYKASVSNYTLTLGLQWQQKLSRTDVLTLGATFGLGHKLGADPTCDILNVNTSTLVSDTTTFTINNGLQLPHSYGIGLSWTHKQSLTLAADVTQQKWGSVDFAAYDENGKVNVMNAAWGMICALDKIALFIDEDHKTTQNILKTKAFTVSIADREHMDVADFFGIATGNKMPDKFERTGYHAVKSGFVNAPVIEEFPVVMECELAEIAENESFYCVVGKIVNTAAEEAVLSENGKVDPAKLNALIFDQFQSGYYVSGEKVGKAWNAGAGLMKK